MSVFYQYSSKVRAGVAILYVSGNLAT